MNQRTEVRNRGGADFEIRFSGQFGVGVSVGEQTARSIRQIVPYLSVKAYGSTALPSIALPFLQIYTDYYVVTCDFL